MPEFTIRPLATVEEYRAAVELQFETWGRGLADPTSATILKIGQKVGGISAGAFGPDGRMLGFLFGLTGVKKGRLVHWSHMLAVRDEARNLGIGRALKAYQHAAVAELGVETIFWTFDPLVARNAHLNFNIFGVRAEEYVRDMYGDMGSELNRGIGTDRFIVAWPVHAAELSALRESIAAAGRDAAFATAPVVNPELGADLKRDAAGSVAPRLRVRVPSDIGAVQGADLAAAAQWRADTRNAFEHLLSSGYHIAGFTGNATSPFAHYLLAR